MKKIFFFFALSLFIIHFSFFTASSQTWKEMMDSTKIYQEKQDFQTALGWAQKALPKAKEEFGELDTNYISNLNTIAELYYYQGNLDSAIEYGKYTLDVNRKLFKGDNPNVAFSLNNLAIFYQYIGKLNIAEPLYKDALEMRRKLFKGYNYYVAISLNNLAHIYKLQGRLNDAEPLYKEALEMYRRLFQGDHPDVAIALSNLAMLYLSQGRLSESEPHCKDALGMRRRLFKGDHPDVAMSLNNLAGLFEAQGRLSESEPLRIETLEMRKRIFKGDHPDLWMSLNNLAALYQFQGKLNETETLYKKALEMGIRLYKGDHPDVAVSLNNLAMLYLSQGRLSESEPHCKEALEMRRRLFKDDHPDVSNSLNNLAGLYKTLGRLDNAEQLCKEAIEMRRRLFKGDHPVLAISLNSLAVLYSTQGRLSEAELLYKEALEMRKRLFKGDHPDLAKSLNNLAMLYLIQNRLCEAEPLFNKAIEMNKNIFNKQSTNLSEKEKKQYWNTFKSYFEGFNSFTVKRAVENPSIILNMYDIQLYSKGLLLNATTKVKKRILNSNDSVLIDKYKKWSDKKEFLVKLYSMTEEAIKKKGFNIDSIENLANELEKELSFKSEDFRQSYEKTDYKWQDVQASLKKGEAAIEIVRFRKFDKKFTDTVYYAALIATPLSPLEKGGKKYSEYLEKGGKNPIELVLLENGNDLEGKFINEYKYQVQQQKKRVYDKDKSLNVMCDLYNQFWAKIQSKLKGIKTVYLSPDGIYNVINLNTLINPKTKKYLIEELDLRTVTSTRDLIKSVNTALPPSRVDDKSAVLFGDPQYNLDTAKYEEIASLYTGNRNREYYYLGNTIDSTTRQGIMPLPGTRVEIEQISDDMQKNQWTVTEHLGADAVEEAIKSLESPRVLHIATHGKFLKDVEVKEDRSFGMETERFIENPLLRSFLLFTGAENTLNNPERSNNETDDGILTAYEAMNLNLDNTELVVLSACETGLGEIKNGEGVYGLQRAFQVAGAKSVIMSLWTVNDETTQELMSTFYKKWLSGKTKRQAFKNAQLELKKKYPEFCYWGAFVMVGE